MAIFVICICPCLVWTDVASIKHYLNATKSQTECHESEMELGHILWPSDPVTRESSDPETQLTRWPCSIMNSKCRLMCEEVFSGQKFLIIIDKSKSLLHGLTSSDFSPTTNTWQWLLSFQNFKCKFCILGISSKTGKTRVSHLVRMMTRWPGREQWPKWPTDPVTQFHVCHECSKTPGRRSATSSLLSTLRARASALQASRLQGSTTSCWVI